MQILPNQVQTKIAAMALLGALALAGCGHKQTAPTQQLPDTSAAASVPTPTASISSTPQSVDKGDAIVLVWRTTNATEASIDGIGPVKPNDQLMLAPTQTTTYHLTAKGDGGSADAAPARKDAGADAPAHPGAAGTGGASGGTGGPTGGAAGLTGQAWILKNQHPALRLVG